LWRFWLKGLQIATVGLADGFRDGDANGAEKRSEALKRIYGKLVKQGAHAPNFLIAELPVPG